MGEPQIQVESSEPEVTVTKMKSQGSEKQAENLMSMTGQNLVDKVVMGAESKEVGKITEIVLNKESKELFAVIEGSNGKKVLPLSELELSDQGDVKWRQSKDKLQQAEDFDEQKYSPIVLDRRLKEFG